MNDNFKKELNQFFFNDKIKPMKWVLLPSQTMNERNEEKNRCNLISNIPIANTHICLITSFLVDMKRTLWRLKILESCAGQWLLYPAVWCLVLCTLCTGWASGSESSLSWTTGMYVHFSVQFSM